MSWSRMSGPRFHHGSQAMSGGLFVAAVSDDTGARPSARHSHRRPPRPPQQQGNGRDWSQRNHNRDKLPPLYVTNCCSFPFSRFLVTADFTPPDPHATKLPSTHRNHLNHCLCGLMYLCTASP
eukprot:TRINITY_DN1686_c0_g1_i1.p1 TRINITY_DN1686_c0_g1~~TRINITY_DN1686_c0_g1_i1.p1  ORF type:complete len:123 (-),score=2.16 TRINITY_DN1686_c0_g1_i1:91-459(-)